MLHYAPSILTFKTLRCAYRVHYCVLYARFLGLLDPWVWDRQLVPKSRKPNYPTNPCNIQKSEHLTCFAWYNSCPTYNCVVCTTETQYVCCAAAVYRGGGGFGGFKPPLRNSEVLTKSNWIANWAENV